MSENSADRLPDSVVIVLFGATGDLAHRMVLPAVAEVHARGLMPADWRLVGCATEELDDEAFQGKVRSALEDSERGLPDTWDRMRGRIRYAGGGFTQDDPGQLPQLLQNARGELPGEPEVIFFLAVPPSAFISITRGLGTHGLAEGARVVFEKPYGTSLQSFEELDATVKEVLDEKQVFRIDHFLGKEGVQTIHVLRFGNQLFGSEWNRHSIDQVQIDVPEDLDVANRAKFYDATGAALDMIVTHLFQVAGQVAMEPPWDLRDAEDVISARERALKSFRPLDPVEDVVLGQFDGYTDIEGVPHDSVTDTYAAVRLWVDTERWRGVPFVLRTGKRMARKDQRVILVLKPPFGPLGEECTAPNLIDIRFTSDGDISLGITVKTPGPELRFTSGRAVLEFEDLPGGEEPISPYASLINDVLIGDRSLFTTAEGLRAAFTAFAPLQGPKRPDPLPYEPGSWGPPEADRLVEPYRWYLPG